LTIHRASSRCPRDQNPTFLQGLHSC